jgi:poly-beta-1,6-N-acetyl-D-glucosamine synthase
MIVSVLDLVLFPTYFLLLFLAIFWLLVLFSPEEQAKTKKRKEVAYFSAIVPAFNEEKSVEGTLKSLISLDYPNEKKEIIVVNDGSTDRTQQIVEKFITAHPEHKITLINQENKGKGAAMNSGLAIAKGKFFACLDADSFIAPNALQVMLPEFDQDELVAAVCPILKVKEPKSVIQKVQWCEYIVNMFYKFLNSKIDCIHVTPGPFSVYKTSVIKKIGWFDEKTITEDLEIAIRMQKHHYRIVQSFKTEVESLAPNKWKALFRQRVRWYKGSVDNTLRYKKLIFNKKYGDFGMVRMPTIILSGIIAVILLGALGFELVQKTGRGFIALRDINFDILTLLKNYSLDVNLLNIPLFKITIAATLIAISLFVMVKSYQLVREKITNYGRTWVSLVTYLLIYAFFLTTVWVYISYMFIKRKNNFWS